MPDDNSAQNQGVEGFGRLVNNNCLNNQQFTPLLNVSIYQRIELWVLRDDNSSQKQKVEDWEGIRAIIIVSTIRN